MLTHSKEADFHLSKNSYPTCLCNLIKKCLHPKNRAEYTVESIRMLTADLFNPEENMSQEERPIIDRVWEFTKDISVKVSKQAEKHWKINRLRVEIASIKHKKNNSCRELGKFVYESLLANTVEEDAYKTSLEGFFVELQNLDTEVVEREKLIEALSVEPEIPESEEIPEVPETPDEEVLEAEPVVEDEAPESEATADPENESETPDEEEKKSE